MDPIKALTDTAGPGGIAVIAVLIMILSGVLCLGRELARERAISDTIMPAMEKMASQMERLLDEVKSYREGRGH